MRRRRVLSWRAVTALAGAAAILAGWPAVEVAFVTRTPITANSGTISDPLAARRDEDANCHAHRLELVNGHIRAERDEPDDS